MTSKCDFAGFEMDLTEWMIDLANSDASFQEFVNTAQGLIHKCLSVVESQHWNVDDPNTLLTAIITENTSQVFPPDQKSQVLILSAFWPNGAASSKVSFGIHTKESTTLLREGKVVKNPDNVSFITNQTSTNYTIVGSDGETMHFIGKSAPKCSCSCSTRKSTKKKSSQKSSSSKSCCRKSSDRRHHKSRCRGCEKYH